MSELKQSENKGDSLIAAIEGNRAGMTHADLVLTCDMMERGRSLWMKECEKVKKERDQWKAYARHLPECDVNDPDPGIPTVIKKCNRGFDKLNMP